MEEEQEQNLEPVPVSEGISNESIPVLSKVPDRVTVTFAIHHEHPGDPTTGASLRFSSFLAVEDQPWVRRVKVGTDRVPLDLGWLGSDKCGLIVVENVTGKVHHVNPTKEELDYEAMCVLEIYASKNSLPFLVRPKEFQFFRPRPSGQCTLLVCSQHAEASIVIHAFPR